MAAPATSHRTAVSVSSARVVGSAGNASLVVSAPVGAIVFPRVAHATEHRVTRLGEAEALRRLLPNAIDRWDTALIPEHLYLLKTLAATTTAYEVELGENVETLPRLLEGLFTI